jgi:hypothetical protein
MYQEYSMARSIDQRTPFLEILHGKQGALFRVCTEPVVLGTLPFFALMSRISFKSSFISLSM